ncbi:DUF1707 domain-containing protein [Propioniciclava sp. MC1595]|uniref:DUF1707 SHOCT-like domain-containing protein n=1 Tax=Propioniciclava sp. MC1595 TaxID=2760308 RepID=UPI0016624A85|nr:DUF1707 domain-containing protein [Propioniciclava sp. MC1595]MBB1494637.1 DUF1707 domain-containing protein [Propioniciclava sp. MC1595]QTE27371.1 DUF1707 domain-containing protein [Propioniciclava sp. MC1595]
MPDPLQIRIGHAERDEAVETLRTAAGDGRLTLDELDGRIEAAMAARTRADIEAVLADLMPPNELGRMLEPQQQVVQVNAPGWSWQDPLVLKAQWDNVVRAGPWEVPPFLELNAVAADVKLNFVDTTPTHEVIDVNLMGGAGTTVLVVPQGWGADVSRVAKGMGGIRSSVAARPTGRQPLLVVRGRVTLGGLKVRHPNSFDTWQRERRLAKGAGVFAKN